MKLVVILAIAIIAVADAQFRFTNPFRGFRLPSFRRPSRPRAPRVLPTQTFTRPITSSSSSTVSRPVSFSSSSSTSSGSSALFEIQGPSQPAAPASVSSTPIVNAPVIQTAPASALREIQGPNQPSAPSSIPSVPVVNAPVQTAPATALREIPSPDMTAVRGGRVINSGSNTVRDSGANHNWQGRNYIISWREGRNGFSHAAARSYCRGRGMRIISLDNPQKAQHFLNLVGSDNAPYFWAGGQISS